MRWFLDTEFNEDGKTIELISIALVSEDGDEIYLVSNEFNRDTCNDWVKTNVLPKLPKADGFWMSRADIAQTIADVVLVDEELPEFWGYFSDYDWVALCQLYGPMASLPEGFPFYCRDLKQEIDRMSVRLQDLPPQTNEHDALSDARWVRDSFLWIVRNC